MDSRYPLQPLHCAYRINACPADSEARWCTGLPARGIVDRLHFEAAPRIEAGTNAGAMVSRELRLLSAQFRRLFWPVSGSWLTTGQ